MVDLLSIGHASLLTIPQDFEWLELANKNNYDDGTTAVAALVLDNTVHTCYSCVRVCTCACVRVYVWCVHLSF